MFLVVESLLEYMKQIQINWHRTNVDEIGIGITANTAQMLALTMKEKGYPARHL